MYKSISNIKQDDICRKLCAKRVNNNSAIASNMTKGNEMGIISFAHDDGWSLKCLCLPRHLLLHLITDLATASMRNTHCKHIMARLHLSNVLISK